MEAPRNAPAITSDIQCPLVTTTPTQMSTVKNRMGRRKRGATSQIVVDKAAAMVAVPEGNEVQYGPAWRNLNP
jgi:hypothetical protein